MFCVKKIGYYKELSERRYVKKKKKHTVIPTIGGKKCRNDGTFDRKLSVAIPTIGGPCWTGEDVGMSACNLVPLLKDF